MSTTARRLLAALLILAAGCAPSWVARTGALPTDTQTVSVRVVATAPPSGR